MELALLTEHKQLLHHLVKHLNFLNVRKGVEILTEEVLRAHLGGNRHLLTLSVEEYFHIDER